MLAVVVALVLFIACTNVANLMVARAIARDREMALRISIGAGKGRLIQLLLIESALMAVLSSLLGGIFAWWSAPFVVSRINPPDDPVRLNLPVDWRVLGFAVALNLFVVLLFGLLPAIRASGVQPMKALRGGESPRACRRSMSALVGLQVAFCVLVLFITGLFVATFERLTHQPTGFVAERVLTFDVVTRNNVPSPYWDQVHQHLASLPGVQSIALASWPLLSGNGWSDAIWINGQRPDDQESYFLAISPGWLRTMGIPLMAGRDLRPEYTFPGMVLVNEEFARRYLKGHNPIGATIETMVLKKLVQSQVVGLVGNARYRDMCEPIRPTVYVIFNAKANPIDWATFVVRTSQANPMTLASLFSKEISRTRSEFHAVEFHTQTELVEQHTVRERLLAMLSLFFATVAMMLNAVGLYGVLNYSVLQRRREIGIRMALGAETGKIAWNVLSNTSIAIVLGITGGIMAGLALQRYLENLLYEVKATDPAILSLALGTITIISILAALPSILYAVRINPAALLRAE